MRTTEMITMRRWVGTRGPSVPPKNTKRKRRTSRWKGGNDFKLAVFHYARTIAVRHFSLKYMYKKKKLHPHFFDQKYKILRSNV